MDCNHSYGRNPACMTQQCWASMYNRTAHSRSHTIHTMSALHIVVYDPQLKFLAALESVAAIAVRSHSKSEVGFERQCCCGR